MHPAPRKRTRRLLGWSRGFAGANHGAAVVEFVLLAPLLVVLLAGIVDVGGAIYARFGLESAVSSGSNFALVNGASVSSSGGATLANRVAALVASGGGPALTGKVVLNNGPVATIANGAITPSGTPSYADSCYCPAWMGSVVAWGGAKTCGSACPNGGLAGRFVEIAAENSYTPVFLPASGAVSTRALVQTQ